MKIVFVRHGESEANVDGIINDDPSRPVFLTDRGRVQAREAAAQLRSIPFVRAFSSQFPRARQTAEAILEGRACTLEVDARLNERKSGMDGLPVAAFNDLVRPDPLHIRPPQGESFVEQMERLKSFLNEIARMDGKGPLLAVSHESPILAARALAGMSVEEAAHAHLPNCAWVEIRWRTG